MSERVHGPRLVKWLEEENLTERLKDTAHWDAFYHRLKQWRQGHNANLDTVDRFFILMDRPLADLPEEFFIKTQNRRPVKNNPRPRRRARPEPAPLPVLTEKQRVHAQAAFDRGVPSKALAEKLGVPLVVINNERRMWRAEK